MGFLRYCLGYGACVGRGVRTNKIDGKEGRICPSALNIPTGRLPTNARAAGRSFAIFVVTSPVSLSPSEGAGKLRALLECSICHIVSLMEPGRTGSEDGLCRMKETGTGSVRKKKYGCYLCLFHDQESGPTREGMEVTR